MKFLMTLVALLVLSTVWMAEAVAGDNPHAEGLDTRACQAHYEPDLLHIDCWSDTTKLNEAILQTGDTRLRIVAFNYLVDVHNPIDLESPIGSTVFLIEAFQREQSPVLSGRMAMALGRTRRAEFLPALHEKLLRSQDPDETRGVLHALGEIKSPSSVPVIVKLFDQPRTRVAVNGLGLGFYMTTLGEIGSPQAIPFMRKLSMEKDPLNPKSTLGRHVVRALGMIGDPSTLDVVLRVHRRTPHLHTGVTESTIEALGQLGAGWTVQEIHPYTMDSDAGVRLMVARALGRLHRPSSMSYLLSMARSDSDRRVRREAVRSLQHYNVPTALASILQNDPEPMVRQEAAQSLAVLGDPLSKQLLESARMGEKDSFVKSAIESSLLLLLK